MIKFRGNQLYFLILTALVLITYFNSLNNAFLSDDLAEIVNNPKIGDLWYGIQTHPTGFIRPVIYWLAFVIGGLNPLLFRLSNILFHLGSTILVFLTINNLLKSRQTAFFTSALFAVHPAIGEAVVWISGGMYPQYSFFFLLSLFFYIKSAGNRFIYFMSVVFYQLSLMSHPVMPIGLFLVYPLYEFCFGNLKKNRLRVIPFFLISIAYVFINLSALPERESTLQNVHYLEKGVDNPLLLTPVAVTSYAGLLFFPKTLTLYHSELAFSPLEFTIRGLATIAFLGLLIISFRKSRWVFFWLVFFWLSLSPTLTPFRLNWIVAERYLYLPSVGIFAILAWGLERLSINKQYKYIIFGLFALIILSLSVRTIIRNIDWKNEDNLWIATGKTSPSSPNTHNNLGDVYGRRGDKEGALREFQTAIALKPNYADAYHNLANTYMELKQIDKALENYQKATEFNSGLWQSFQNIAAIHFQQKQYDKALENIQKAIQINPKNIGLRNNLGIVFLAMGEKEKAKEVFQTVLSADPQNQFAKMGLVEASK